MDLGRVCVLPQRPHLGLHGDPAGPEKAGKGEPSHPSLSLLQTPVDRAGAAELGVDSQAREGWGASVANIVKHRTPCELLASLQAYFPAVAPDSLRGLDRHLCSLALQSSVWERRCGDVASPRHRALR